MGSRILGGVAHGMFWSIVGAYAGHLVPKEQIARAVSITIGGGTLAFIFGVPLGTFAGHAFGWRWSFAILAGLMVVGAALVWKLLPAVERDADAHPKRERGAARPADATIAAVIMVCLVAAVTMIGHYSFYTFVVPFLTGPMGVPAGQVGGVLFFYGIAGAAGLMLAGSVLGRRPQLGLVLALVLTGAAVAALAVVAALPVPAMVGLPALGPRVRRAPAAAPDPPPPHVVAGVPRHRECAVHDVVQHRDRRGSAARIAHLRRRRPHADSLAVRRRPPRRARAGRRGRPHDAAPRSLAGVTVQRRAGTETGTPDA